MGRLESRHVPYCDTSEVPVSAGGLRWSAAMVVLAAACSAQADVSGLDPETVPAATEHDAPMLAERIDMVTTVPTGGDRPLISESSVPEGSEESDRSVAPASNWVVFEEVDPDPLRWPILEQVRIPQADTDAKGAGHWFGWRYLPLSAELQAEGLTFDEWFARRYVIDLCGIDTGQEDPFTDEADPEDRLLSELIGAAECPDRPDVAEPVSCVRIRSDGSREPCPEPEPPVLEGDGRWRVDDECSVEVHGTVYRTQHQAWQAAVAHRGLRTLPLGAQPLGLWPQTGGRFGCGGIQYAEPSVPVDEVRLLPETVFVADGSLRGLVRNWSRALWAWDVQVHADGRVYRWPLTVQPGETAPFELPDWDGPADAAFVGFSVTAEMSVDADISRALEIDGNMLSPYLCPGDRVSAQGGLADPGYGVVLLPEVLDDFPSDVLETECLRRLRVGGLVVHRDYSDGIDVGITRSHPSMHGRLAPGLIGELRAYLARLDEAGRVTDLLRLTPFNSGGPVFDLNLNVVRDEDGEARHVPESITREYPPLDGATAYVELLFEDPFPNDFMIWVGGAHLPDA